MANPNAKDPEHEFTIKDVNQTVLVYERDYMREFLQFLKDSKPEIEPIIFTTAEKVYADHLLDIVDPDREIFEQSLYRNACYLLEKKEDDLFMFIKDISRFSNRDLRRSVLLDSRAVSFIMSPKNGLPCQPYTAEFDEGDGTDD